MQTQLVFNLSLNEKKNVSKTEFEQIIDRIHNLLYKYSITGQKALNDIVNIMFMFHIDKMCKTGKLILPSVRTLPSGSIEHKMFNTPEGFGQFLNTEENIIKLIAGFHKVSKLSELNCYFPSGLILNSQQHGLGLLKILLNEIHIMISQREMKDYDPNGILYEKMINGYLNDRSSKLGQFFTPRNLVDRILEEVSDTVDEMRMCQDEKKSFKVFDPFMGTGGFLTHAYNRFHEKIPEIELYGSEIEPDTFKYGAMNALITTGKLEFDNFSREDSIRKPSIFKTHANQLAAKNYDLILTNPPFGLKFGPNEIGYKDLRNATGQIIGNQNIEQFYCRIPTTSGSFLALQLCMYLLAEQGVCAIVLPRGQEVNGTKTLHKNFIAVRQCLVECFNLLKILDCPKDTFEHTSVETTVLIFTHGTTEEVEFKSLKTNTGKFINLDELRKHTYSFEINAYVKKEKTHFSKDFELKKLGEICTILPGGKHKSEEGVENKDENNIYPLFYCSILGHKYLNIYDEDDEICVINKTNGSGKSAIYYYNGKYAVANSTIRFRSNSSVLTKYIYYYLSNNMHLLVEKYQGVNQKSITNEDFLNIEIPIPDLGTQEVLIQKFDRLQDERLQIKKLQEDLDFNMKELIENYHPANTSQTQKLGGLCEVTQGDYITKTEEGKMYPLYGGGDISYYVDKFNHENEFIIAKDGISEKCVRFVEGKFFLNHHGWILYNCKINKMYLGYYLMNHQHKIYNLATGLAQKGLNKENIYDFDIPVPDETGQQKIIKFYQEKEKNIEFIKHSIENLDKIYNSTYLVAKSYF